MMHAIISYLGNIVLVMCLISARMELKRLRAAGRRCSSMTVTDFQIVYNWIKSGMPEAVAQSTPPGFAQDAMRLVWFAVKGEKR